MNDSDISKDNPKTLNSDDNGLNKKKKQSKFILFFGIILVFLIAIFYTSFIELSQLLVTESYNKPFIVNWFNTIIFLLSFLIELILLKLEILIFKNSNSSIRDKFNNKFKKIKLKKLIILSLPMSILFVMLNWLWMWGLTLLQASISMALYQSTSIFCFILSVVILKEKIKFLKTMSVLLCIAGVIGIAIATFDSNNKDYPHALKGEIFLLISAALWAIYEVLTFKYLGETNRTVVSIYMGFIALFSLLWGLPIIVILDKINFESFYFPDKNTFGLLFLNAILSYSLNFLINLGLSITKSPLYVRSGELMTIPLSLFIDLIFKNVIFPLRSIPGYCLIILGFLLSIFVQYKEIKKINNQSDNNVKNDENNNNIELQEETTIL